MNMKLKPNQDGCKKIFFAVTPSEADKQQLLEMMHSLSPGFSETARWALAENLHMTLCFLGWVDEDKIDEVIQQVKVSLAQTPDFLATSVRLGFLPAKRPRSLVLHMQLNTVLAQCFRAINQGVLAAGGKVERRAFVPHITLAHSESFEPSAVLPGVVDFSLSVGAVRLFSSVPQQGQSNYHCLAEIPLM